ncbi:DUF3224 domain-containing protein [Microlunatus soli]|uniref:DUF3224 domain-containing protein n=1 Tax=Microlunatus soli TaxID=630515 RepID=A0A1H1P0M4_9ACTN|nr:DUF3224 domain-containing protein [Microlunatus soli]SDS04781.1 Protein of unknown function [Microlunatus soli]
MHAKSTFTVADYTPTENPGQVGDLPMIDTAASAGLAYLTKTFTGELSGRSVTWFLGALNQQTGAGSYVALEAISGEICGRSGTFNVVHGASTHGADRTDEHFRIVPDSGTGELVGISGTGTLSIDPDGTHHFDLDYRLPD